MWCIECEQEVNVTGKSDRAPPVCPHCDTQLQADVTLPDAALESFDSPPGRTAPSSGDPREFPSMPPMHWDDWQLDADADQLQILLDQFDALIGPPLSAERRSNNTQPEVGRSGVDFPRQEAAGATEPPVATRRDNSGRSPWPAWLVLSTGLMLFVCGTILAGWSLVTMRSELWLTGVPISLVGIACLLVGFVLQLESLWSGHRATMKLLLELDERMGEIRHATTMLKTSHSGAAQSFYANLAEGASPQLLLADLKGQLDLLANQLANQSRRAA